LPKHIASEFFCCWSCHSPILNRVLCWFVLFCFCFVFVSFLPMITKFHDHLSPSGNRRLQVDLDRVNKEKQNLIANLQAAHHANNVIAFEIKALHHHHFSNVPISNSVASSDFRSSLQGNVTGEVVFTVADTGFSFVPESFHSPVHSQLSPSAPQSPVITTPQRQSSNMDFSPPSSQLQTPTDSNSNVSHENGAHTTAASLAASESLQRLHLAIEISINDLRSRVDQLVQEQRQQFLQHLLTRAAYRASVGALICWRSQVVQQFAPLEASERETILHQQLDTLQTKLEELLKLRSQTQTDQPSSVSEFVTEFTQHPEHFHRPQMAYSDAFSNVDDFGLSQAHDGNQFSSEHLYPTQINTNNLHQHNQPTPEVYQPQHGYGYDMYQPAASNMSPLVEQYASPLGFISQPLMMPMAGADGFYQTAEEAAPTPPVFPLFSSPPPIASYNEGTHSSPPQSGSSRGAIDDANLRLNDSSQPLEHILTPPTELPSTAPENFNSFSMLAAESNVNAVPIPLFTVPMRPIGNAKSPMKFNSQEDLASPIVPVAAAAETSIPASDNINSASPSTVSESASEFEALDSITEPASEVVSETAPVVPTVDEAPTTTQSASTPEQSTSATTVTTPPPQVTLTQRGRKLQPLVPPKRGSRSSSNTDESYSETSSQPSKQPPKELMASTDSSSKDAGGASTSKDKDKDSKDLKSQPKPNAAPAAAPAANRERLSRLSYVLPTVVGVACVIAGYAAELDWTAFS
jgi:hypothetical protein